MSFVVPVVARCCLLLIVMSDEWPRCDVVVTFRRCDDMTSIHHHISITTSPLPPSTQHPAAARSSSSSAEAQKPCCCQPRLNIWLADTGSRQQRHSALLSSSSRPAKATVGAWVKLYKLHTTKKTEREPRNAIQPLDPATEFPKTVIVPLNFTPLSF